MKNMTNNERTNSKRREFLKSSLLIGGASLTGWSGYVFKLVRDYIWQPNYEGEYAQPQVFHSFDSVIRRYNGIEHDKPAVFCVYSLDCSSCIEELEILAEIKKRELDDGRSAGEHINFYFVDWDIWQLENGRKFVYSQLDYEEGLTAENLQEQLEDEDEYMKTIGRLRSREGIVFTPLFATPDFHYDYNIRLVPRTLFVNSEGLILYDYEGGINKSTLEHQISRLLSVE